MQQWGHGIFGPISGPHINFFVHTRLGYKIYKLLLEFMNSTVDKIVLLFTWYFGPSLWSNCVVLPLFCCIFSFLNAFWYFSYSPDFGRHRFKPWTLMQSLSFQVYINFNARLPFTESHGKIVLQTIMDGPHITKWGRRNLIFFSDHTVILFFRSILQPEI